MNNAKQADNQNRVEDAVPNAFEQKQAARKNRYVQAAASAEAKSDATLNRARSLAGQIPFGQPILFGHHSERRDRNFRDQIHNTFGKGFALQDQAAHYLRRAQSVGSGGISSDDPAAIGKLRKALAGMEANHTRMKQANLALRQNTTPDLQLAALLKLGYAEPDATGLLKPKFGGRVGFPPYSLSNNSGNMRRVRERIALLEQQRKRVSVEQDHGHFIYREDVEQNRLMFIFEDKPDVAIRSILKSHAFKWSPTRGAWVRLLNPNARFAAKHVIDELLVAFGDV